MEYKVLNQSIFLDVFLMTINVTVALVCFLLFCVCCKRKMPKNELLGLEGMVKLKNPDEVVIVTTVKQSESQADLNASTISNADSEKRASTAAHRSLPDIPVIDANGDTGSELYETVADKRLMEQQRSQNKSPTSNLKKQISISQHSSISQADDISSPYSRVKNSPHGYAKVLSTEHPYAQLNAPSTSAAASSANFGSSNVLSELGQSNLLQNNVSQDSNTSESQVDIPAASAIAGMISASQDLPYMTPPVANQNFSGDSQDSSKGYTSISVREPLANILAQQPPRTVQLNSARDANDSHYATVSDDSDETYAAIEDPNLRNNAIVTDIYTSGSETYAQIQPMQSVVVSVEINNCSSPSNYQNDQASTQNNASSSANIPALASTVTHSHLNWPSVQPSQIHSRQASSSSNNSSSVGNLGSPKPEKRQANSPLPPTPKSTSKHTTSNSNLTSGRNSIISVIEMTSEPTEANDKPISGANDGATVKKNKSLSPSKDIEGMYAKVMKKNKFSIRDSPPSQHNSPVMSRKHSNQTATVALVLGVAPLTSSTAALPDSHRKNLSSDERYRARCNSYSAKDHGYETIPADINRKSDCYTNILQKERQQIENNMPRSAASLPSESPPNRTIETTLNTSNSLSTTVVQKHYETIASATNSSDPGYETLKKTKIVKEIENEKKSSEYDPNYEVVKDTNNPDSAGLSDDGYAKVTEKKQLNIDEDSIDGYSKIKGDETEDGYSTIRDANTKNHNYASISEAKFSDPIQLRPLCSTPVKVNTNASSANIYKIRPSELPPILSPSSFNSSSLPNTSSATSSTNLTTASTLSTHSSRQTPSSSQYESLTGSETDPNYESVSYVQTNRSHVVCEIHPYELLHADCSDTRLSSPLTPPVTECSTTTEQSTLSHSISTSGAAVILNVSTSTHNANSLPNDVENYKTSAESQAEVIVDDYFQV